MLDTTPAEARDAGASLALEAEPRKFDLEFAISKAARLFQEFSSDHVWEILGCMGIDSLEHPNAMGGAFISAANSGVIESTGRFCKTSRLTSHRRNVTLWRSLIFRRGDACQKP